MRSPRFRLAATAVLALVLLLGFSGAPQPAHAGSGLLGLVVMQIKGYIIYSTGALSAAGTTVTFSTSLTTCMNGGGVPASDTNTAINTNVLYNIRQYGATSSSMFFTGSSAAPSTANPNHCINGVKSTTASPNSWNCYYRWIYGYYSVYSYNNEIGTAYWSGLYPAADTSTQELNQFGQYIWNPGTDGNGNAFPRGYYYGVGTPKSDMTLLYGMDSNAQWTSGDLNAQSDFMVVCEVQMYPELQPTTTRMPQPVFINGFKNLTWPQEHWWVLFLIVAVIIVVILFGVIIYCCCTSRKPVEQPPLFQMVLRERVGKAYVVNEEEGDKQMRKPRGAPMPRMAPMPQAAPMPQPVPNHMDAQNHQMRLGRGFNPNQNVDPDDVAMGAAGIYNNGERRQYADGNAFVDEHGDPIEGNFKNIGADALPDVREVDAGETASQAPSATMSKRRSARKGRSRTMSQTFEDVEVPQAGEIDETNVNL